MQNERSLKTHQPFNPEMRIRLSFSAEFGFDSQQAGYKSQFHDRMCHGFGFIFFIALFDFSPWRDVEISAQMKTKKWNHIFYQIGRLRMMVQKLKRAYSTRLTCFAKVFFSLQKGGCGDQFWPTRDHRFDLVVIFRHRNGIHGFFSLLDYIHSRHIF